MASIPFICMADDQADFRILLQHLFIHHLPAYPVRFFASGYALLDALADLNPKPSLIFLDRHMPHLDGHQTLVRLKDHPLYKAIPVVMMSADATAVEINGCYEAGANSFLIKKLDFGLLKEMLESTCRYWLETNQQPIQV